MCQHHPEDILEHLREVEGRAYQSDEWNSLKFASHMWDRVLQRGALEQLGGRLSELTQRGVLFTGLHEAYCQDASILHDTDTSHVLLYKYVVNSSAGDTSSQAQKENRAIYLEICFNMDG